MSQASERFPTDVAGLPEAGQPQPAELDDGELYALRIAPVAKQLGEHRVRMLAFNGSIPGPLLRVREAAEIVVEIENQGDLEALVHWHGLRLDNRYDGTHETQQPIAVGEKVTARVRFDDPGIYWYHPHVREDYSQELGLYGNVVVEPADPDYWPPADRELALTLDDILLEEGKVASFSPQETTFAAMGRFGDLLLVNGEPDLALAAQQGEVVRFYLTNTANTRVFRVALPGAQLKLVGGDSGHVEQEELVAEVILSPSERAVVDALFEQPGELSLEHRTPGRVYELARINVSGESSSGARAAFGLLRTNADVAAERERIQPHLEREPDKTLAFIAEMDMGAHDPHAAHRDANVDGEHGHDAHSQGTADGIEWDDDMVDVNRLTTPANISWKVIDRESGAENTEIDWRLRVGDQLKIRLANEMAGDHPMHHPFHIHGAGRFLILARDGVVEPNLVWKDTVLVRAGETIDILLDVTNPGRWMAHCHIAEHHESGMLFSFDVEE